MKIGVTATSKGGSARQLDAFRLLLAYFKSNHEPGVPIKVIHGDCVGGDDQMAKIANEFGCRVIAFPGFSPRNPTSTDKRAFSPSHEVHPPLPFLVRDNKIVEESQALVAMPYGDEDRYPRSGTWYTVRRARKLKIPVFVITRDGTVYKETNPGLLDISHVIKSRVIV